MISIIVAVAKNGVIGKSNTLPWSLPAELGYFRKVTKGHPVIMGLLTHQSIGRPLPDRTNIVLNREPGFQLEGCSVASSIDEALKIAKKSEGSKEIFFIGGASVYEQALPLAEKLYLTDVNAKIDGDKFFRYNQSEWREQWSEAHKADDKNKYDYTFRRLVRKSK